MNLLIVDDEPIIRIGLRTLVDWDRHGLRLVGEAADGREALDVIAREDIDILVTDIRMPRMDGLELIRNARETRDDLGVLVLSCLDDFAFVKEAMKLGASDYILKPTMEPEELVAVLLSMKQKIEQTRSAKRQLSEWQAQLEQSKHHRMSQRLARYLQQDAEDPTLECDLFGGGRSLFTLLALTGEDANKEDTLPEPQELVARFALVDAGTLIVLPIEPCLSRSDDQTAKYAAADRLAAQLGGAGRGDPVVLVGPTVSRLTALAAAVKLHERQRHRRFYGEPARIVWEEEASPLSADAPLPYEPRNDLLRSVAHHNADGMLHHTEQLCRTVAAVKPPLAKLHSFLFELLVMAVGNARDNGYAKIDEYERKYVSMAAIRSFHHIDPLSRWLTEAMRALWECRWGGAAEPVSGNPFIRKALQFMKEHYKRNIGTVDIAEYVKLSRSYLSDLYSKEMGESLIETLTRIRIDEAKKRLAAGDRKIYEVAEEVGFSDPKSFAKTFKRMVGCTPKEYEASN